VFRNGALPGSVSDLFPRNQKLPFAVGALADRKRETYGLTVGFLACARFLFFAARRREEHAGRVRSPFSDTLSEAG